MKSKQKFQMMHLARTAIVSLLLAVPLFGLWVEKFLRGREFWPFAGTFVMCILTYSFVRGPHHGEEVVSRELIRASLRGALVGYIAGVIAYFAMAIMIIDGVERLKNTLEMNPVDFLIVVFASPLFLGLSLYGALVFVASEWMTRRR